MRGEAAEHGAENTYKEPNAVAKDGGRKERETVEVTADEEGRGGGRRRGREHMGSLGPWDITVPQRGDADVLNPPRRSSPSPYGELREFKNVFPGEVQRRRISEADDGSMLYTLSFRYVF